MPPNPYHAAEARFLKLAILERMVTPNQLRRAEEMMLQKHAGGQDSVCIEQVLLDERMLTEEQCERLWERVTQDAGGEVASETDSVPRRLGGYEIISPIGKGGMGTVYKARQITMERDVALKILKPELARDARYIRRFFREARAAGALNHGNIVRVYDVGEAAGRYYFSMEYVEGKTLKTVLKDEGRIPVVRALDIMLQTARALSVAHKQGIIHRDIKPDNILLAWGGRVKLADLGLAKRMSAANAQDSSDTQDGLTLGTPHYMSPEQGQDPRSVDARSDLYSLGSTIFHAVTGQVPFDGETPVEILVRASQEDPPRADDIDPLLPRPFCDLLVRIMARLPPDRPASADDLLSEIEQVKRHLADEGAGRQVRKPYSAPSARALAHDRHRLRTGALALLGSLAFLALCAAWRFAPAPAPAPPSAFFPTAPSAPRATPAGPTPEDSIRIAPKNEPAPPAANPGPRPVVSAKERVQEYLKARPDSYSAALRMISEALRARQDKEEIAELHRLRTDLEAKCRAAVERDLKARLAVADALARDGLWRKAEAEIWDLREDYPDYPATELIRTEVGNLWTRARQQTQTQADAVRSHIEAGRLGHAMALVTWLAQCAERDEAAEDFRRPVREAGDEVAAFEQRRFKARSERRVLLARLAADLRELRGIWDRRDADGVIEAAKRMAGRTADAEAKLALELDAARAKLLARLHRAVVDGINNSQGRMRDNLFMNNPMEGVVEGATIKILTLSTGGGNLTAPLPWDRLTHAEYRKLAQYVIGRFSSEDPGAMAGLAFAENKVEEATSALRTLAKPDAEAQAALTAGDELAAARYSRAAEELQSQAEMLLGQGDLAGAMRRLQEASAQVVAAGMPKHLLAKQDQVLQLIDEVCGMHAPFGERTAVLPGKRWRWAYDLAFPETLGGDWIGEDGKAVAAGAVPAALKSGMAFAMALFGNFETDVLVEGPKDKPFGFDLRWFGPESVGGRGTAAVATLAFSSQDGGEWGWRLGDETAGKGPGARLRAEGTRKISVRRTGRRLEWLLDGEMQEVRILPVSSPLRLRFCLRQTIGPEGVLRRMEMVGRVWETELSDALARRAKEAERRLQEAEGLPPREKPDALEDIAGRYRECAALSARARALCAIQLAEEKHARRGYAALAAAVGLHRQPEETLDRLRESLEKLRAVRPLPPGVDGD